MEKIFKEKTVLQISKQQPIIWKQVVDTGFTFEIDDVINASYEEPFYSDNNSHDGYYYFQVKRKVLETDEEFEKRKLRAERDKKELKERRRETYLKLKKEFENE